VASLSRGILEKLRLKVMVTNQPRVCRNADGGETIVGEGNPVWGRYCWNGSNRPRQGIGGQMDNKRGKIAKGLPKNPYPAAVRGRVIKPEHEYGAIYKDAQQDMLELGYRLPPAEEELLEHEIKHIEIALKEHYKDEWCSVCDNIARKLGFNS